MLQPIFKRTVIIIKKQTLEWPLNKIKLGLKTEWLFMDRSQMGDRIPRKLS